MNTFEKLGLDQSFGAVLDDLGFEKPTEVQEKSIPQILQNDPTDFIGIAQTGTGKTAAFGLPLLQLTDASDASVQALVMAPTRELGQQIAKQFDAFSTHLPKLNIEVVYGGAAITNQIKALKRPTQIVVATPGRLLDLIRRRAIKLGAVKYVVLDEADEMLKMGFKEDMDEILSHTPEEKSTWLFSATMPGDIRRMVKKFMNDPLEVSVDIGQKTNKDISHQYVITKTANKLAAIRRFLDIMPEMRGIMFCRTRIDTQNIAEQLGEMGYGVEALHGDLSQGQRDAVMKRFKARSMQLLIATDVAARGIDVEDLTHVFHHKLPDQNDYYTHRSGRTARAGKKGISLAFINPRENRKIQEIERRLSVRFEKVEVPNLNEIRSSRISHWASLISSTKVDPLAENILETVQKQFANLSKEEILKRLITTQLDHLSSKSETIDLNESQNDSRGGKGERGKREGRGERRNRRESAGEGDGNRYFINLGTIDGLTQGDLVHFLSDTAGVKRETIGNVSIQKNCAFFDLESESQGFVQHFKGLFVDDRPIRVNKDDDGPARGERSARRSGGGGRSGGKSYGGASSLYGSGGSKKRGSARKNTTKGKRTTKRKRN